MYSKGYRAKYTLEIAGFIVMMAILFITSCKKEKISNSEVVITFPMSDTLVQFGDSIQVSYEADNEYLTDVSLFINGQLYATQQEAEGFFNYKPHLQGASYVHVLANYEKGFHVSSDTLIISALYGHPPDLVIHCERIDGLASYFVGEQLNITVLPEWEWMDINDFKQITLRLNGESLGTLTSPPFTFPTSVIDYPDNIVNILLVDSTNFKYDIEMELYVPVNTPPELEFQFYGIYSVKQGYYYSTDSIITRLHGVDNINIHYVDYYLDDQYFSTDTTNSGYFFLRKMNYGFLPAGDHSVRCIAYDERGLSTSSEPLSFIIYKTFEINEQIIDIKATSIPSMIYAVSTEHLFEIDPREEKIIRTLDLPATNPTALATSDQWQKLFIAFQQGQIFYLEYGDNDFTAIDTDTISNIEDIEIEEDYNFALLISHLKVMALDLSNANHFINVNTTLYEGSKMVYWKQVKNIIAGGNPQVSGGYVYKYQLNQNSIDRVGQAGIGGFVNNLILSPNNKDLLVTSDHYNTGYPAHDVTNFFNLLGKYEVPHAITAAYNSDGSAVYLVSRTDKEIVSFNSASFSASDHFYIPIRDHNEVNHILSDNDDSKLILSTTNVFEEEVKMIFVVKEGVGW